MATTRITAMQKEALRERGLIRMFYAPLNDYVYIGGFKELSIKSKTNTKEAQMTDDCVSIGGSTRRDWTAEFKLLFTKSPWILKNVFGFTGNITTATPINIVDEETKVDILLGDGIYGAILNNINYDETQNYLAQTITVKDSSGATIAPANYTVSIMNGFTIIKMVAGGTITQNQIIKVSYTYTPAVSAMMCSGSAVQLEYKSFVFENALNTGTTVSVQDKMVHIMYDSATIESDLEFVFLDCKGEKEVGEMSVTVKQAEGKDVCFDFQYR